MKFTQEDLDKYRAFARHIEKSVEWHISTSGLLGVNTCISWFNELGQKIKAEVEKKEAPPPAKITTTPLTDEQLQEMKLVQD